MSLRRLVMMVFAAVLVLTLSATAAQPGSKLLGDKVGALTASKAAAEPITIEAVNLPGQLRMRPGGIIVRLSSEVGLAASAGGFESAVKALGGTLTDTMEFENKAEGASALSASRLHFAFLNFPAETDLVAMAKDISKIEGVLYAEPDFVYYPDYVDPLPLEEPLFFRQFYLENTGQMYRSGGFYGTDGSDIGAVAGWQFANNDFGLDSSSVTVGVIDQGVCFWIPEITPNMWVNEVELDAGANGIDDDFNGVIDDVYGVSYTHEWDDMEGEYVPVTLGINDWITGYKPSGLTDYHASHVAGTISGAWDGVGTAGATYNTKIMSIRFLGEEGGFTSDAIRGLAYASAMGADLTSNSWGGGDPSLALADAIRASGMLFVSSAGNEGDNGDFMGHYPSSYAKPGSDLYCENILSVAATDANDQLVSFSNYGVESVHVAAPGQYILAPMPDPTPGNVTTWNYYFMSGTSMATPLVSAVASLVVAQDKFHPGYALPQYDDPNPSGNWDTVKEIIINSAEKKSQLEGLVSSGGRVDMYGALTWQRLPSARSISVSPTFSSTAAVTLDLSVDIDGGDSASVSSVDTIVHRWSLYYIDPENYKAYPSNSPLLTPYMVSDEYVYGTSTELVTPADMYGNFHVLYEMVDVTDEDNPIVVSSSYKQIVIAEPEAVLLVQDDQWYGQEWPSDWGTEYALWDMGIPYYLVWLPMELPTDIPNVVFWSTYWTTSGVITEEDAQWMIGFLNDGGRLLLSSYEMLNVIEGYDRYNEETGDVLLHQSALSPETAEQLLELLKIKSFMTDHTLKLFVDAYGASYFDYLPFEEFPVSVAGNTIVDPEMQLRLDYLFWDYVYGEYTYINMGDVVTDFGPGAYPFLLSEFGGAIDEADRAAYGLSYAGDDYRLIFLGIPLEALSPDWETPEILDFYQLIFNSVMFLKGEGQDRLVAWLEAPLADGTYSNPLMVEWGIDDPIGTIHEARLWYRNGSEADWEPITLFVPGEEFGYLWNFANTLVGSGFEAKLEVRDAEDTSRVAYDFEAPFAIWPSNTEEGARAGVDREDEKITFFVNALKPGTLYVYDLSGTMLFSREVPAGMSEVVWNMMFNGVRVARGLYAFRVVYNDGSASKTGRVLVNF